MKWSLACMQGACIFCRILHDPKHPSTHSELANCQHQKVTTSHISPYVQDVHWMRNVSTSYPCDLISLHWFLSGDIFLIRDFCLLRWWRCRHLHLRVDMCLKAVTSHVQHLTLAGFTKSQFVRYLSRQLISLAPTNEESAWAQWQKKTYRYKNSLSYLSACDVTCVVNLGTKNLSVRVCESGEKSHST